MSSDPIAEYGWAAVPRSHSKTFSSSSSSAPPQLSISDLPFPDTEVVKKSLEFVKEKLRPETLNHSLRVYYYGLIILRTSHLPEPHPSPETWLLTCLFHDIGTTQDNLRKTHLSFEFFGGMLALQQLREFGAPLAQAESVCEAIIRHQDPGESGMISALGALVQAATQFDNMGDFKHLVHEDSIKDVTSKYPRNGWSGCFSKTIREEISLKPWCHTTALEGFAEAVEGNKLMAPYD